MACGVHEEHNVLHGDEGTLWVAWAEQKGSILQQAEHKFCCPWRFVRILYLAKLVHENRSMLEISKLPLLFEDNCSLYE